MIWGVTVSSWDHPHSPLHYAPSHLCEKTAFRETSPWCQNGWGPLVYHTSLLWRITQRKRKVLWCHRINMKPVAQRFGSNLFFPSFICMNLWGYKWHLVTCVVSTRVNLGLWLQSRIWHYTHCQTGNQVLHVLERRLSLQISLPIIKLYNTKHLFILKYKWLEAIFTTY